MVNSSQLFDWGRFLYGAISYRERQGKILPPLRVIIEPTYRCNCRCPFCYVEDHSPRPELTTEQWLSVIEQIPRYAFISFEGGEVTLRRDFMELLRACRKRVWGKVNVLTNGTVLNAVQLGELVDCAPLVLSVSLDGLENTHNSLRGEERFAKVWDTLEHLVILRRLRWPELPLLDVKLVLLPENLAEVPELYERCAKLGVDFFSISLRNDHHLKQNAHLRAELGPEFTETEYPVRPYLDLSGLRLMLDKLGELRRRYPGTAVRWAPKLTENPQDEHAQLVHLLQSGSRSVAELYRPCRFPFANLFINPSGDVYPCLSVRWGNVLEKPLAEIYNGAEACEFRCRLRRSRVFKACQMCCEAVLR